MNPKYQQAKQEAFQTTYPILTWCLVCHTDVFQILVIEKPEDFRLVNKGGKFKADDAICFDCELEAWSSGLVRLSEM